MIRFAKVAAVVLAAWALSGCGSTFELSGGGKVDLLPPGGGATLLAGVGRADITPRPGLPTAGYATNGNSGTGFRTRLHARVIYLRKGGRRPVALVQCDLLSGTEALHRRVAELVARETDLDAGGIVVAGTHTHSGPGNLFGSDFYVKHASNEKGLDREHFDFTAGRIARAVIEAYRDRGPARIATGSVEAYGFTRNRSIDAYRANRNADPAASEDIRRAVNPVMHMVRVDRLDGRSGAWLPAAALTSFSIHGTAVPSRNTLYNGDVYAYMERELEWEVRRRHGTMGFVHAVVNGTHGDCAPDCSPDGCRGYRDARRLGTGLGRKAVELFDSLAGSLDGDAEVLSAYREVDLYRHGSIDGIALCDPPRVGNTLVAGVQDGGPTPVASWFPMLREGSRRRIFTGGCQGSKRIFLGGTIQSLVLPRDEFPHVTAYQAVRLGDVVLLPLPYEVTLESGRRIEEACRKAAAREGTALPRFVVVSASNGYTGYCTTPEEYGVQRYEGGHTLYGPNTAPFVAAHASRLAGELARGKEVRELEAERTFRLTTVRFYRAYGAPAGSRGTVAAPSRCADEGGEECRSFRWADVPPDRIDLDRPLVSIECSDGDGRWAPLAAGGIPVDDDGYDLSVEFTGGFTKERMAVYETRWYNPESREGRSYRFRIEPREGQGAFHSPPFR